MNGQAGDRRELFLREPGRLAKGLQLRTERSRSAKLHALSFYCDTSQAFSEFRAYRRSFQLLYKPSRRRWTTNSAETFSPSARRATVKSRLWINRFVLCSGQEANATSQPHHAVAREPEGRAVWLGEFVGAKHGTHQANVVVIRSAEQHVTYFVRQHASQRASKIMLVHDPADRGSAYASTLSVASSDTRIGRVLGAFRLTDVRPRTGAHVGRPGASMIRRSRITSRERPLGAASGAGESVHSR